MDLSELAAIVDLMRQKGVRSVTWQGCSVVLGADPADVSVQAAPSDLDAERYAREARERADRVLFRSAT